MCEELMIRRGLNVGAEEIVLIDDDQNNITAAVSARVQVLTLFYFHMRFA